MSRPASTTPEPRLQPLVRHRVRSLGPAGAAWQAALPAVLDDLAAAWGLTYGRPLPGGTASYVVRATTADGDDAVVKVAVPDDRFAREVETLARAGGRGYVRLLAHDLDRRAVLLERCGDALDVVASRRALATEAVLDVLAQTVSVAWLPPPGPVDRALAAHKARGLAEYVVLAWEAAGRPCSRRLLEAAVDVGAGLAVDADPARCVTLHGDPHPGNALRVLTPRAGAPAGVVLADPDGFVGEPEYDLGVVLRDWSVRLRPDADPAGRLRSWADRLATTTGADADRVLRWAFLERVSTGLHVAELGATAVARPFLDVAERLLP